MKGYIAWLVGSVVVPAMFVLGADGSGDNSGGRQFTAGEINAHVQWTQEQRQELSKLQQARTEDLKPLYEQFKQLQEELKPLMEQVKPLQQQMRQIMQQVQGINEQFEQSLRHTGDGGAARGGQGDGAPVGHFPPGGRVAWPVVNVAAGQRPETAPLGGFAAGWRAERSSLGGLAAGG